MKKLFLLLFFLCTSLSYYSQVTKYQTTDILVSRKVNNKWVSDKAKDCYVKIVVDFNIEEIRMNSESEYMAYSILEMTQTKMDDGTPSFDFDCKDSKGKPCLIKFTTISTGVFLISVIYENISWGYRCVGQS